MKNFIIYMICVIHTHAVPDLPLCFGVLKHRAPMARRRGGSFLPKNAVYMSDLIKRNTLTIPKFDAFRE
jgi:hypothetical protein